LISHKVSILKGTPTGPSVYVENFEVMSTPEGIFTIVIGNGTRTSGVANLLAVDWASALHFLNLTLHQHVHRSTSSQNS
jgi:hypothetical protein